MSAFARYPIKTCLSGLHNIPDILDGFWACCNLPFVQGDDPEQNTLSLTSFFAPLRLCVRLIRREGVAKGLLMSDDSVENIVTLNSFHLR